MATRVSEAEVLEILDVGADVGGDAITPFLRAASVIVTDSLAGEYGAATLAEIETWLAAHLYSVKDPVVREDRLGDGTVRFHGKSGLGLDFSPYGQQVRLLDSRGILVRISSQRATTKIETLG